MTPRQQIIEVMARAIARDQPDVTDLGRKDIDENWPAGWEDVAPKMRSNAIVALTALESAGYQVRPREATDGMRDDG